jgi:hypothetical protein
MNTEQDIRRLLDDAVSSVEPSPAALGAIRSGVMTHRRRRRVVMAGVAVTTAAAVVATVLALTSTPPRKQSLRVLSPPSTTPVSLPDGWSQIPKAPNKVSMVALWTGHEVVVGSECCATYSTQDLHGYSPLTRRWQAFPPTPLSKRIAPAAAWTGHEILVFGGRALGAYPAPVLTDGAALDPASGTWRPMAPAPYGISNLGGTVTVWTGHEVLVWDQGTSPGEHLLAYDPGADKWRQLPPSGLSPRSQPIVAWVGSRLMVWGGQPQSLVPNAGLDSTALADGALLDPMTGTWTRMATPATRPPLVFSATAWTGSEVIFSGGYDGTSASPYRAAAFDPASNTWRTLTPPPAVPEDMTIGVWTGRELFVTGGYRGQSTDVPPSELYDPKTDTWRTLTPPPLVSNEPGRLDDGRHVAFATWTGSQVLLLDYLQEQPPEGFTWTPSG